MTDMETILIYSKTVNTLIFTYKPMAPNVTQHLSCAICDKVFTEELIFTKDYIRNSYLERMFGYRVKICAACRQREYAIVNAFERHGIMHKIQAELPPPDKAVAKRLSDMYNIIAATRRSRSKKTKTFERKLEKKIEQHGIIQHQIIIQPENTQPTQQPTLQQPHQQTYRPFDFWKRTSGNRQRRDANHPYKMLARLATQPLPQPNCIKPFVITMGQCKIQSATNNKPMYPLLQTHTRETDSFRTDSTLDSSSFAPYDDDQYLIDSILAATSNDTMDYPPQQDNPNTGRQIINVEDTPISVENTPINVEDTSLNGEGGYVLDLGVSSKDLEIWMDLMKESCLGTDVQDSAIKEIVVTDNNTPVSKIQSQSLKILMDHIKDNYDYGLEDIEEECPKKQESVQPSATIDHKKTTNEIPSFINLLKNKYLDE
jgi:hypothetical protein